MGTSTSPALTTLGNVVVMAWKGIAGDQSIYWTVWDGTNWAPQSGVPGVGTSESPALATLKGVVVMAWKGIAGDDRIWFTTFDGAKWAPQALVPNVLSDWNYNFTSVGPALTTVGDVVYMTWKGDGSDPSVYYCYYDGYTWSAQQTVSGIGTSFRPALCPFPPF